jgi:hypothetical protein
MEHLGITKDTKDDNGKQSYAKHGVDAFDIVLDYTRLANIREQVFCCDINVTDRGPHIHQFHIAHSPAAMQCVVVYHVQMIEYVS